MKKILVILLAAMITVSVSACSNRDKPSDSSSDTSSSSKSSAVETDKSKEAQEKLDKIVKREYGKDAKLKFVEEKEINKDKCFVYKMDSGIVSGAVIAINEAGDKLYQQEMGGGNFLAVEPVVTPAKYFIDMLQSNYAGNLVKDLNAVGSQIKAGTYSAYPSDFVDGSKFPQISDTEQLIYCYHATSYLNDKNEPVKLVNIIVPIDDTHVMICNPTMVTDETSKGKKLALTNFTFEKDFNLEKYAKDNDCEILKGNMVK